MSNSNNELDLALSLSFFFSLSFVEAKRRMYIPTEFHLGFGFGRRRSVYLFVCLFICPSCLRSATLSLFLLLRTYEVRSKLISVAICNLRFAYVFFMFMFMFINSAASANRELIFCVVIVVVLIISRMPVKHAHMYVMSTCLCAPYLT